MLTIGSRINLSICYYIRTLYSLVRGPSFAATPAATQTPQQQTKIKIIGRATQTKTRIIATTTNTAIVMPKILVPSSAACAKK